MAGLESGRRMQPGGRRLNAGYRTNKFRTGIPTQGFLQGFWVCVCQGLLSGAESARPSPHQRRVGGEVPITTSRCSSGTMTETREQVSGQPGRPPAGPCGLVLNRENTIHTKSGRAGPETNLS
jgi:hypothetical protein